MHFILIQLFLALTASAVPLIDIGQLYDQKLPIPYNDIHNSNGGVDIGELYEYKKSDPINYPTRSKRSVEQLPDVNELGSKDGSHDIGQLYDQSTQTTTDDVNNFQDNRHDIDELFQYNSTDTTNYPLRSKRSGEQLSDVSEFEYKDGSNDNGQLYHQNSQITTDDVINLYNEGKIEFFYLYNSTDAINYSPRSKRSNEQLSDVSGLEINNNGINNDNDAAAFNIRPSNDDVPIDIGSLYDQERKIPRNELPGSPNNPGPLDIEDLYEYKGNYPAYPKY